MLGAAYAVETLTPYLEASGTGSIVMLSSTAALESFIAPIPFNALKAALITYASQLSQAYAAKGIRVNTVAPGPIWTPLIPATMRAEQVEDFGSQTPLGRAGQPVEVAHAFVFLASAEASYITGERVGVHGGMPLP